MKLTWLKGLSVKEKEDMKAIYQASAAFRKRQQDILEDKINSVRQKNTVENAYESPNWALKQADAVGYERALQEIKNILD